MLWRSIFLLTLLNALAASARKTASEWSILKSFFIAWIAALLSAFRPHICAFDEEFTTSSFMMSPGFLSRCHQRFQRVVSDLGCVHFLDGVGKFSSHIVPYTLEVSISPQPSSFMPDGPTPLFVSWAALSTISSSIASNIIELLEFHLAGGHRPWLFFLPDAWCGGIPSSGRSKKVFLPSCCLLRA